MTVTYRTVYSYTCQQCGRRVRMANYVKKCNRCGKTLCRRCARKYGYCPTDWDKMLPEDHTKFSRWKRGLILRALMLLLFIGAMIGVLVGTSMGNNGYIGFTIGFFAVGILFAIIIGIQAGKKHKIMAAARFSA